MTQDKIPFWRNTKNLNFVVQLIVIAVAIATLVYFGNNLSRNFQRLGLNFGFAFLGRAASFDIANAPLNYSASDPYIKAIAVGLINSLQVMFLGILIATVLGITVGIARLSDNWLVSKLASMYIEVLRNTPLLLQLFFWYFAVFLRLPKIENAVNVGELIFLSNRGLTIPGIEGNLKTICALLLVVAALIGIALSWRKRARSIELQEASRRHWLYLILVSLVIAIATFFFGIPWSIPNYTGTSITAGANLSPELAALLIGLSTYTASFIAEVVRAGIQSVSKGQWEAARALGLRPGLVMRLIVFPQALRVMIPPLTSEFLNLAKNSSLAIAIGYNDVYAISNTISNQTGKSVEMLLIVMFSYLTINLIISVIMNRFNSAVQLQER